MKEGYSQKRIKDICRKDSSNVAQKELKGLSGKYPIYGASGLIQYVNFYHQENEYIGIVKDGSGVGRIMFLPSKSSVIGTLQYILPKDGYNIRYIGYCLQSLNLASYNQGATIPHIYFRDYGETNIFVADDVAEQQRIVEILDAEFAKIDALRANAMKSLQAAKDLFQTALKQELQPKENWTVKSLKEIAEAIGDGLHGTPNYVANGDCYFINGNNLIEGKIVFNKNTKKVSNVEKEKYYIPLNLQTILISINGSLGKTAFYNGENIILGKSVCFIILKAGVNKYFVYHILASNIFMEYAEKEYTGLTIKNISLKSMRNFVIHFPSEKEQTRIVSRLDQLNERCKALQENYDRTISLCEDLKQALLRKAFNGEL